MSSCCNAPIKWTDICSNCLEHCDEQEITDKELSYLIQSLHPQFDNLNKIVEENRTANNILDFLFKRKRRK